MRNETPILDDDGSATDTQLETADGSLLDLLPDAVIAFDSHDRITTWNAAAERLYGYPAGNAVGESVLLFVPHAEQARFCRAHEAVRRSGAWSGDLRTQTIGYQEVLVEARWSATPDGGTVCLHTDVGERRRLERRRRETGTWTAVRRVAAALGEELSTGDAEPIRRRLRQLTTGPDPTECGVYRGMGNAVLVGVGSPVSRELIGAALAAAGYAATVAANRAEVLERVEADRERFQAAVLDYGDETEALARELRRHHPLVPVVDVGRFDLGDLIRAVAEAVSEAITDEATLAGA